MKKTVIFKEIILILVTIIWGLAFIFQVTGGKKIDAYTFNFLRNITASLFLIICFLISIFYKKKRDVYKKEENIKELIIAGVLLGIFLSCGMTFQQLGINSEGAGKSGFLTALYVIFVPILEILFIKKIKPIVLISAVISLVGLYLINVNLGKFILNKSTIFLILCAISYAFQIMTISRYSKSHDTLMLSFLEFFISSIILVPFMLIFGSSNFNSIVSAIPEILFLGILSSGVAYTLQIYAQSEVNVTVASIIMSLESVFSLIFGIILLSEEHTFIQYMGCLLIFVSVILSQLDFKNKHKLEN